MKRTVLWFICAFLWLSATASPTLDSLLNHRDKLREEYLQIISTERSSADTDRRIFDLQNRIINTDDIILTDFLENSLLQYQAVARENALMLENIKQQELQLAETEHQNQLILYGAIMIAVLCLLFFILYLIMVFKLRNLQKKPSAKPFSTQIAQKPVEREELLFKLQKEKEELQLKLEEAEKRATDNHILILQLKNDIQKLQEQLAAQDQKTDIGTKSLQQESAKDLSHLQEEINLLQLENQKLKIAASAGKEQQSQQEIKNLDNQLNAAKARINELEQAAQTLQHEIQHQNHAVEVLQAGEPEAQAVIKLQEEIKTLRAQVTEYENLLKLEEQARIKLQQDIQQIIENFKKDLQAMA